MGHVLNMKIKIESLHGFFKNLLLNLYKIKIYLNPK